MNSISRLALVLLVTLLPLVAGANEHTLPQPAAIQPAVNFWVRIYSEVTTQQGLLHDRDNLAVVYDTLTFKENLWHPSREKKIRARRAALRDILLQLADGKRTGLSRDAERVLALWPDDVSAARLRRAADNIRFQLGQADRFRRGLERSGAWEPHMREIMAEMGLPQQLAALPHVESSFNPDAYSRVGAAGIWQFTRLTGRRFMRVDHVVDERMDPFTATRAAGRLLKLNHSVTNNWALAITAYNHGLAGIRRAARTVGSNDIADIIARYNGRNWGFASRNFYPAFLAAVEVDENAARYFGAIDYAAPLHTQTVTLPFYTTVDAVLETVDVDRRTLRNLNRGLLEPVWQGKKYIPRGYALRLPLDTEAGYEQALASIPGGLRFETQVPDRFHTVARGETLSTIGARYGLSVRELMMMNALTSAHQIRAGATLRLPVHGPDMSNREIWRVARGDTLESVAAAVGMTAEDLASANGMAVDHALRPGDVLRVDGESAVPEQAPATTTFTIPASLDPDSARQPDTTPAFEPRRDVAAFRELALNTVSQHLPDTGTALSPEGSDSDNDSAVDLSADPSDYTVSADNSIEIQAAETLGHYAEWLDVRASALRRINSMSYGTPLVIGERLTLDFSNVNRNQFENRRRTYHSALQSAFFSNHHIRGSEAYSIRSGDSLWSLTAPRTEIPLWLMRQYNPDVDFSRLHPGDVIQRPVIATRSPGQAGDAYPR